MGANLKGDRPLLANPFSYWVDLIILMMSLLSFPTVSDVTSTSTYKLFPTNYTPMSHLTDKIKKKTFEENYNVTFWTCGESVMLQPFFLLGLNSISGTICPQILSYTDTSVTDRFINPATVRFVVIYIDYIYLWQTWESVGIYSNVWIKSKAG